MEEQKAKGWEVKKKKEEKRREEKNSSAGFQSVRISPLSILTSGP